MRRLNDLLDVTKTINLSNAKYYELNSFDDNLAQLSEAEVIADDAILTPFYICEQGILEIYDYELNIRKVNSPSTNNFILTKTGKKSLDEVDPAIEQKLKHCYIEIILPKQSLSVNKLQEYVNYLRNSFEVKARISDTLHEFCDSKFFFEVY